jgi:hypothetical protein
MGLLDGDENKTILCYDQTVHRRHQATPRIQKPDTRPDYAVSNQTWSGHMNVLAALFRTGADLAVLTKTRDFYLSMTTPDCRVEF